MGNWIAFQIVPQENMSNRQYANGNHVVMFNYGENRMWSLHVNQITDDNGGFMIVGWAKVYVGRSAIRGSVNETIAKEMLEKLFPKSEIYICGKPGTNIWWLDSMKRSAVFTLKGGVSRMTGWSKKTYSANPYSIATGALDEENSTLKGIIFLKSGRRIDLYKCERIPADFFQPCIVCVAHCCDITAWCESNGITVDHSSSFV